MNINWTKYDQFDLNEIISLEELLQRNRRKKKPLNSQIIKKFSLEGICKKNSFTGLCEKGSNWMYKGDQVYNLVLTAPFGIVLTYEQIPQALISFEVSSGLFSIKQNKGIKPILLSENRYFSDSIGLRHIRNNVKLMYEIAIQFAQIIEMYVLEVESAKNRDDFYRTQDTEFAWKLVNTFDLMPFNLNFQEDENGNWFKIL